ncbi:hypothetical protein BV110_00058 [Haemophilus influenzae]|nr:hypothetical protein BV110_00058 [Haemophilus influenzae]
MLIELLTVIFLFAVIFTEVAFFRNSEMVSLVNVVTISPFFLGLLRVPSPFGSSLLIPLSWREWASVSIVTLSGSSNHSFVLTIALLSMDK